MASDEHKAREIIVQTERIADQILMRKRELVALDKRRQETREAIRLLETDDRVTTPRRERIWITIGSVLMKVEREKALDLLRKDHEQLESEITLIRQMQKVLVTQQRDLEHEQPLRGFDLKPLTDAEIYGLRSNLPGF